MVISPSRRTLLRAVGWLVSELHQQFPGVTEVYKQMHGYCGCFPLPVHKIQLMLIIQENKS